MTLTSSGLLKPMFVLIQTVFYSLLLLLITHFPHRPRPSGIGRDGVGFLIWSLRTWWCQLGFMALHCSLSVPTAFQDCVPFRKNSCPLLVSCHPLILCIIFVVTTLPQVGKLVVACCLSAVYSTEPWRTVCTGFLCPSSYPLWYNLYSVESNVKPQINK